MGKWIVGVDLGTSSTKFVCLCRTEPQLTLRLEHDLRNAGERSDPGVWLRTLSNGFEQLSRTLDLAEVGALCLTGQTNTYVFVNDDIPEGEIPVLGWTLTAEDPGLPSVTGRFPDSYFREHISMDHPRLESYPLPRFAWVRSHRPRIWQATKRLMQPKDYVYYRLTGEFLSDPYTWRGLANLTDVSFHAQVLADFSIPPEWLPELSMPWEAPAAMKRSAAEALGLRKDVRLYLGCNDFFASTAGIGVTRPGASFDVTGTSEHIGRVVEGSPERTGLVAGPYFRGHIHYGATANTGRSLEWVSRLRGTSPAALALEAGGASVLPGRDSPLFLPYLRGERAPVFDGFARGVFFGLTDSHSLEDLTRAVLEGVAFSAYHIWQELGDGASSPVRAAGGATRIGALNVLKSSLFGLPFEIMDQTEAAALGAALIGAMGEGWYDSLDTAARAHTAVGVRVEPDERLRELLGARFDVYRRLYSSLKESFSEFAHIAGGEYE